MKAIAVIPAFNEEKRITTVLKKTKKYVNKIIVVDDGSIDNTSKIAKKAGAEVIRYESNQGVGYATKVGLKKAISFKPDIIVFLDADGQHNPKYIPYFIEAIKKGADYVCGKRDLSKYPFNRKIGNFGLTLLSNLLCPTGIIDTECGYRALSLKAAKKLELKAKGYEREMEFVYNVWKNKFKVKQIKLEATAFYQKSAIKRGFKNFFYLLKRRFNLI
ncbi:MAG: glycosyltransferase family 2 protein [Candidatus Aenigmatarchaeota archaeon]